MDEKRRTRISKALSMALHAGTGDAEALVALYRIRAMLSGADFEAVFAGLGPGASASQIESLRAALDSARKLRDMTDAMLQRERQSVEELRTKLTSAERELAKRTRSAQARRIVSLEETVEQLSAQLRASTGPVMTDRDTRPARNTAANAVKTARAKEFARRHRKQITTMRGRGYSLADVAQELNASGIPGPSGGAWSPQAVRRVERSE